MKTDMDIIAEQCAEIDRREKTEVVASVRRAVGRSGPVGCSAKDVCEMIMEHWHDVLTGEKGREYCMGFNEALIVCCAVVRQNSVVTGPKGTVNERVGNLNQEERNESHC